MSLYSIMSFPVDCLYHHRHAKAWPYYLCSSSPKHNPNSTLSLHWAFNNILVVLKDNFDFELAILSVVPTTFRFTIPFAWCRRWSITSSWNFSTNVSWSSSTFWALPGYQSKFMMRNTILAPRYFVLSSTTFLPSFQHRLGRVLVIPCISCYSWNCSLCTSCDLHT